MLAPQKLLCLHGPAELKKIRQYDVTKRFSFQDWKDNLNVGSKIEAGLYV